MATETTRLLDSYIVNITSSTSHQEQLYNNNKEGFAELDNNSRLSLEELLKFENDPWWQNIRKTFIFTYLISIIVLFIAAIVLCGNSCNIRGTIYSNDNNSKNFKKNSIIKEYLRAVTIPPISSKSSEILISETTTSTNQMANIASSSKTTRIVAINQTLMLQSQ